MVMVLTWQETGLAQHSPLAFEYCLISPLSYGIVSQTVQGLHEFSGGLLFSHFPQKGCENFFAM